MNTRAIVKQICNAATGALLVATLFGGCKQAEGERCQIDQDCENGLVCHSIEKVCSISNSTPKVDAGTGQTDATPAPDANTVDAATIDAF